MLGKDSRDGLCFCYAGNATHFGELYRWHHITDSTDVRIKQEVASCCLILGMSRTIPWCSNYPIDANKGIFITRQHRIGSLSVFPDCRVSLGRIVVQQLNRLECCFYENSGTHGTSSNNNPITTGREGPGKIGKKIEIGEIASAVQCLQAVSGCCS